MFIVYGMPIWVGVIVWILWMCGQPKTKKCGQCAEPIMVEAKVCKHCHSEQVMPTAAEIRAAMEKAHPMMSFAPEPKS